MDAETKKHIGIGLVLAPVPLLALTLFAYAVSSFAIGSIDPPSTAAGQASAELSTFVGNIVNVMLGFVGLIATLGILIGIPVGVFLIIQSWDDPKEKKQYAASLKKNPHYSGGYHKTVKQQEASLKKNPHYANDGPKPRKKKENSLKKNPHYNS